MPRWLLERFGSQHDPIWGSSWAPLGTPRGPKMQYVLRCFDVFAYSRLSTEDAQYHPKKAPSVPQEAPRGAQERPTGAQEEPKTAPGRPQDGSKTAPRWPKSRFRTSLTIPGPPSNVYDRSGCSKKPPRGPQEPPKDPPGRPKTLKKGPRGVNLWTFTPFPLAQTFSR